MLHFYLEPGDTTAPVLSGVDDVTMEQDSEFEPLAGVSATDDVDGDVTDAVKVSGSVDAAKPGEYVLTYTVSDKTGNTATAERMVTVKAKEGPTEPTEPMEPGKPTEPTEPSESDDDKTEASHGQHGGRQNQHGLSATGVSVTAVSGLVVLLGIAGGMVLIGRRRCLPASAPMPPIANRMSSIRYDGILV